MIVDIPSRWRRRWRRVSTLLSGNVAYLVTQAAALAVVTRRAGGEYDAADFLLAQAIATPVSVLVAGRVRDQFATGPMDALFAPRLRRLVLASLLVGLVGSLAWSGFATGQREWVGIWVLWSNLAKLPSDAAQGRAIRRDDTRRASFINLSLGCSSLASMLIGYRIGGLVDATFLMAISWLALGVGWSISELRRDQRTRAANALRGHDDENETSGWSDDLGVGLSAMAMMAQPSVARIGVSAFAGPLALAQFGTVSQVSRLGSVMMNAGKSAVSVELADLNETSGLAALSTQLRQLRLITIGAGLVGLVAGAALGPGAITLVFSESVRPDRLTCALMAAGTMPLYASMLLNQVGIAGNQTRRLLYAGLAGLAVTGLLLVPLVSTWGASGGAAAVAAGNVTRFGVLDRMVQTFSPVRAPVEAST